MSGPISSGRDSSPAERVRLGASALEGGGWGSMLCGVGRAAKGLRARLALMAEQKFCRPLGATKLPGLAPRAGSW